MGPKTREWGFHTRDGWIMWKDYYAKKRAEEMPLDKYGGAVFWKALDEKVDALTERFIGAHDGKVFIDEDVRLISTIPGDFDDEAPTEPQTYADLTISREDFYKKVRLP
jgi:hypothetical protein